MAKTEGNYQPPTELVRIAKAAFAGSFWQSSGNDRTSLFAVLFDSFLQPVFEGTRLRAPESTNALSRGSFSDDLQLEVSPAAGASSSPDNCEFYPPRDCGARRADYAFQLAAASFNGDKSIWESEKHETNGDLELVVRGRTDVSSVVDHAGCRGIAEGMIYRRRPLFAPRDHHSRSPLVSLFLDSPN